MTKRGGAKGYREIQRLITRRIEDGELHPGDRVGPIRELAKQLDVSALTVDRALRELAQQGVLDRVPRQGFFVAKAVMHLKGRIHAILPTLDSRTPFSDLLDGILGEVWPLGYQLSVCCTQWNVDTCLQAVHRAVLERTHGVIYTPAGYGDDFQRNREALKVLRDKGLAVATVGHCRLQEFPQLSGVSSAHEQSGYEMTRYLLGRGERRIAVLGVQPNQDEEALLAGYRRALEEAGLPFRPRLLRFHPPGESSRLNIKHFAHARERPDAIFALSDREAAEAIVELGRLGLSVPGDVPVVGFGDYPLGRLVTPPLTTMRINLREVGSIAAGMLIEMIENEHREPRRIELPCELVVRESCGGKESA